MDHDNPQHIIDQLDYLGATGRLITSPLGDNQSTINYQRYPHIVWYLAPLNIM